MKKAAAVIFLTITICALALGFGYAKESSEAEASAYLRVHIRANSNSTEDQAVKYSVRDGVVSYLTPFVAECTTKSEAMELIGGKLQEISRVADGILRQNGFYYGASAYLREEEFPTRVYEEVTLSAGVYDALILELGTGAGDNWWCVVYPPLCFSGGNGNIVYKSKIAEIIKSFFGD